MPEKFVCVREQCYLCIVKKRYREASKKNKKGKKNLGEISTKD